MCGGTFTGSKGIIESPFYPNPFPVNKICTYLIKQPIGKAIELSIMDLDMKISSYLTCYSNSLEVK